MAHDRTSSVLWFVAGAALGATVALLYAPHSGRHTRYLIKQRARQGVDKVGEYSSELAEKGRELYDRGKAVADEAAEMFERGKRLVEG
jgi:gas vesicle protein